MSEGVSWYKTYHEDVRNHPEHPSIICKFCTRKEHSEKCNNLCEFCDLLPFCATEGTFIRFPWTRLDLLFYFCHKDLSLNWKQEIRSKNRLKGHNWVLGRRFAVIVLLLQQYSTSYSCAPVENSMTAHFRFWFSLTCPDLDVLPQYSEVIYRSGGSIWLVVLFQMVQSKQHPPVCVC